MAKVVDVACVAERVAEELVAVPVEACRGGPSVAQGHVPALTVRQIADTAAAAALVDALHLAEVGVGDVLPLKAPVFS